MGKTQANNSLLEFDRDVITLLFGIADSHDWLIGLKQYLHINHLTK